jgi:hypothetical protein
MPTIEQARKRPDLSQFAQVDYASARPVRVPSDPGTTIPDYNPLSLAPPPAIFSTDSDRQKQFYRRGVSQFRIPPLPSKSNPSINASIQSISKTVAQQVVAAQPPATSGTDLDLISRFNGQQFGGFDTVVNLGGSSSPITIKGSPSTSQEVAFLFTNGGLSTLNAPPSPPWTGVNFPGGGTSGHFAFQNLSNTNQISFTDGGGGSWVGTLAFFRRTGTVALHGSAPFSVGLTGTAAPFTTTASLAVTAGDLILVVLEGFGNDFGHFYNPFSITATDNAGNTYFPLANSSFGTGPSNGAHGQIIVLQATAQTSATITITVSANTGSCDSSFAGGGIYAFSFSGVTSSSSSSYTFQQSDNNNLVQFGGSANVITTLPSPALTNSDGSTWQCLVSNVSLGTVTLSPASGVQIVGSGGPVIPSGGFAWIASDGTNYRVIPIALPQRQPPVSHNFIQGFEPSTGAWTTSRPSFADLSGSISTSQMAGGSGANAQAYWRGDGTWQPFEWNALVGGTGNAAQKYLNIPLVSRGIPSVVALSDVNNATANVGLTTLYAVPNTFNGLLGGAGFYRLHYYVAVNRAATTSSTLPDLQIGWTDWDTNVAWTAGPFSASVPTGNTQTTGYQGTVLIWAKNGTNITFQLGNTTQYASSGATSMQYSYHLRLEAL